MGNKRIYVAGPLFSQAELEYNEKLNDFLLKKGFCTFLPQKDGYELSDLVKESNPQDASTLIFNYDLDELKKSDILVFIMDGRVPDEGACVEVGIAYALGKECYGLKTDTRSFIHSLDNPMIIGALKNRIAHSFDSLLSMIG
jgi:nucleoside 2-deoxyribosyltransferase